MHQYAGKRKRVGMLGMQGHAQELVQIGECRYAYRHIGMHKIGTSINMQEVISIGICIYEKTCSRFSIRKYGGQIKHQGAKWQQSHMWHDRK
jgi:hypothetical protein